MGIEGLLPIFTPIIKKKTVIDYKGTKVAIDAYSWIHKGKHACIDDYKQHIFDSKKYI